jgi:NADH-quinone oxidoreductase subunit G
MSSELQGNVIDLCPVGALTSAPYAFQARPWELNKTESIDVMDALGSSIRVDSRDTEVMRILPRTNEDVNEEWISDKTRFVWDGIRTQRLDRPYVREKGRLRPASWQEAFEAIAKRIRKASPEKIGALAGDLAGVEEMFALKDLMSRLGVTSIDCRQDGAALDPGLGRASYLFNATVAGIEDADAILIVGANPRHEAPVLNARIRKVWLASGGRMEIGVVLGDRPDLTYDYAHLGAGPETLADLSATKGFGRILKKAERPLIIVGQGALARSDGRRVLAEAARLAKEVGAVSPKADPGWNGFSVLHTAAARVGGLDIGFVPGKDGLDVAAMLRPGALDVAFLLGADEVEVPDGTFVIYQGTHGDRGAHRADVILPAAAFTEKSATYVNTEGRVQMTRRAVFPPGDAREDWAVLRALSEVLDHRLPYDSLGQLRATLYEAYPHLARLDEIEPADGAGIAAAAKTGGKLNKQAFRSAITDFYLTNAIARASAVMAELSAMARLRVARDAAE